MACAVCWLAPALTAQAQPVLPPASLTVTDSLTVIRYNGAGLAQQQATDPWFTQFSGSTVGGALFTSADLPAGVLRSRAQALGGLPEAPLGVQQSALASFRISLLNSGPSDIVLPAGWLTAEVDAVFSRTVGAAGLGGATHNFTASLGGNGPGLPNTGGNARLTYNVGTVPGAPPSEFLLATATPGFASHVLSAGLAGVDGRLSFAAVSLVPGARLDLNFSLSVLAAAPRGAGWDVWTDASQSAVLSMQLPAGVTLNSPVPLAWVSVVPEPSTAGLMLAGVLGLGLALNRRRRRRLTGGATLAQALAALVSLTAAGSAQAQLVVVDHEVVLQLRGPGLPSTTPRAPWFLEDSASTAAGTAYALADLAQGDFKVATQWTGAVASGIVQQARAIARVDFRNDHGFAIVFPAGAIWADLSGSFGWTPGTGLSGISNQLYSRLVLAAPAFPASTGGISNSLLVFDQNQNGFNLTELATPAGATVVVHQVSQTALAATLGTSAFTLAPGETARLSFSFEAQSFGTNGWSAFVDAAHSALLTMQLPAGVTLVSPQPLAWVSVVPEPCAAWLLLAGLAGVGARVAARRRVGPSSAP